MQQMSQIQYMQHMQQETHCFGCDGEFGGNDGLACSKRTSFLEFNILYTPGSFGIKGSSFLITSFPISELSMASFFRNLYTN